MAGSSFNLIKGNPTARLVGLLLAVTGVVLIVVLMILEIASGDDAEAIAATTVTSITTTTGVTTTTAIEPTTTTAPPTTTTTETTTTTATPVATTEAATTTTQVEITPPTPDELVAEFVEDVFVKALEAQDADALFDHIHPVVLATFSEEACRVFIQETILLIEGYVVTGDVEVGIDEFTIDAETIVVDPVYTAPVEFVFQGQTFTNDASFAPIDGSQAGDPGDATRMAWFTACS